MPVLSPAEQRAQREGRLAASVTLPTGKVKRWGPDERETDDILAGLSFTTSDPGGFKTSNFGLARDIDIDWPDLGLLLDLKIYGPGGRSAWEGRLQERPGRHADDEAISPGAVGWSSHLSDRPFQEIYVDRDLSRWGDMSIARKLQLLGAGFLLGATASPGWVDGATGQALSFDFSGVNAGGSGNEGTELWYYGNGVDIGQIIFDQIGDASTTWDKSLALGSDETMSSADVGVNYSGIAESNGQGLSATVAGRKYARARAFYTGAFVGQMTNIQRYRNLTVWGRSGIPQRGGYPSLGVYASDAIADIVGRFAPELAFTTGQGGSITPTEYVIPQLAFHEPITPANAILAANAYHQHSWGVEDGKSFFYRPTSTYRKRWRIRRSRGDQVELLGPQADAAINGVVVTFTDPAGVTRTIGPPAMSTAYTTSEALVDTRATNPVNMAGINAKWGEISLGFVTDIPGAIQVGSMWLAAQLSNARGRGSVRVTGVVEDEHGAFYPSWAMRAGDSATVVDGDAIERRIVETTYGADSRQVNCQLDSTPHKIEALFERMGIALMGVTD